MFGELSAPQIGYIGWILGCILVLPVALSEPTSSLTMQTDRSKKVHNTVSAVTWIALLVFFGLLVVLPSPYRFLMWTPYGIFLPLGIRHINKRQQQIQVTDASFE